MKRYDEEQIYCRMLGHHLAFHYCRTVKDQLPCHKIMDCWFERIDIKDFLKVHYSDQEIAKALAPPPPKMASLVSLIEKAKNRQK